MSRIKGRYVAQLIIDIDTTSGNFSAAAAMRIIRRSCAKALKTVMEREVAGYGNVELTEQYFDLYEVKEDDED